MIYFYANDEYVGKVKLTPHDAQKIVKNMNVMSVKQWDYSHIKKLDREAG